MMGSIQRIQPVTSAYFPTNRVQRPRAHGVKEIKLCSTYNNIMLLARRPIPRDNIIPWRRPFPSVTVYVGRDGEKVCTVLCIHYIHIKSVRMVGTHEKDDPTTARDVYYCEATCFIVFSLSLSLPVGVSLIWLYFSAFFSFSSSHSPLQRGRRQARSIPRRPPVATASTIHARVHILYIYMPTTPRQVPRARALVVSRRRRRRH